jgi:hypothetical protein
LSTCFANVKATILPRQARDKHKGKLTHKEWQTVFRTHVIRHILQSVEMPAATNARASGDYIHPGPGGGHQWDIGTTSILAHAVGLAPSKDNYWSNETEVRETPLSHLMIHGTISYHHSSRQARDTFGKLVEKKEFFFAGRERLWKVGLRAALALAVGGAELLRWASRAG